MGIGRQSIHLTVGLALLLCASPLLGVAPKDVAQGRLVLRGKTYTFAHGLVYQSDAFDEQVTNVVLSDRPLPLGRLKKSLAKDGTDEDFAIFSPHIKVTFTDDGKASYTNTFANNTSLGLNGPRLTGELRIKDGRATGMAKLAADAKSRGETSSFEIRFDLKLLVTPTATKKPAPPAASKPKQTSPPASKSSPGKGDALNAYALPIPKGASDVKFKALVKQIAYKSDVNVPSVAQFLTEQLNKQGWKKTGSDLLTPRSSILKREHGNASLTLFVRADGTGSSVTIMTKGLSWEKEE